MAELKENRASFIEITASDLPLHCPQPEMVKWSSHPRVFLPIESEGGEAKCPYCGTLYKLTGAMPRAH